MALAKTERQGSRKMNERLEEQMKQTSSLPRWLLLVIGILTSGALYFFSTGLEGFRPLVWIAPVPVLILALQSSWRFAAAAAFVAYLLGSLNLVGYLAKLAPIGVAVGSLVIPSIAFAIAVFAYRFALLHLGPPISFVIFPVVWTSYEYLLSIASPHGTAGSIAYSQTDFSSFVQISSLTGIWGMTFILTLVPAGIATAWYYREKKKKALAILLSALTAGFMAIGYGWIRLGEPVSAPPIRIGVAAIDSTAEYFETTQRAEAVSVIETYARVIGLLAEQGAKVVVLPEKLFGVADEYESDVFRLLGEVAQHKNVFIVAGLSRLGSERNRNLAAIISPDGKLLAEYDKAFLIPGFESKYRSGTKPVDFNVSGLSAGVAICKDMDFPGWIRRYGNAGVGILFVPAWDFTEDAWLHSRMAILRAVENGLALARSAKEGFLTVCDFRGRIIGEVSSSESPEVYFVSDVMPGPGRTFYSMAGDWFAWANLFLLSIFLLNIPIRKRRARSATH